jgi:hypothetical protein
MYDRCLFCTAPLGTNRALERFQVGSMLAYDSVKGRLWVVCRSCERWNLTAFDERWEAIEECEQLFHAARQRVCSDHIGLARLHEGLEIVRVGPALLPEFAAWRYGDQFGRRRRRTLLGTAGLAAGLGAAAVGAVALGTVTLGGVALYHVAERLVARARARRVIARIRSHDGHALTVLGEHLPSVRVSPVVGSGADWKLEVPHARGVDTLRGEHALQALSLIMPALNGTGWPRRTVVRAIRRLENFDDPRTYLLSAAASSVHARPGGQIVQLPPDARLAIEMAANEENERCALEGEMFLLQLAWEEAEEIAAIADGLVPSDIEQQFEHLKRRATESDG